MALSSGQKTAVDAAIVPRGPKWYIKRPFLASLSGKFLY